MSQEPPYSPDQFEQWLAGASPDALYCEAERIIETKGLRSIFVPVTRRIMEIVTNPATPVRYKTNLLMARECGSKDKNQIDYYEDAIKGAEKLYGKNSPEVLSVLEKLAATCRLNKLGPKGERAAVKLLERLEAVHGLESETLINALLLRSQFVFLKRLRSPTHVSALWPEQEKFLLRALLIAEKHYPNDNKVTAKILYEIATLYQFDSVGQFVRSAKMYRRLHNIPSSERGDSFPCSNFGKVLMKLGHNDQVAELRRQYPEMKL